MGIEQLKIAIEAVVEYNWADERDDFIENEESRPGHIFRHLVALNNFLIAPAKPTPESYLPDALCECGRRPVDCATYEDAEAEHGDR